MLLMLAALLLQACADTNSNSRYRDRDAMLDRTRTCATCGAAVSDGILPAARWPVARTIAGGGCIRIVSPGQVLSPITWRLNQICPAVRFRLRLAGGLAP
jgi:hypothetical protein